MNKNTINIGKDMRRLVPRTWESSLLGSHAYTKVANGWSEYARSNGLFIDLSRLEWVELSALVPLTLFAARALLDGIKVTVALPLPRPRKTEDAWISSHPEYAHSIMTRVNLRIKTYSYLEYLRFVHALQHPHLCSYVGQLSILDNYDEKSSVIEDNDEFNGPSKEFESKQLDREYTYKLTFPLTWIQGTLLEFSM